MLQLRWLFILKTSKKNANQIICIGSFDPYYSCAIVVGSIELINQIVRREKHAYDWYFVIYDDEYIDAPLNESLPILIQQRSIDFFVFMKMNGEGKISQSPRMFRTDIELSENSLIPKTEFSLNRQTRILDGFIKEQDAT